MLVKFFVSTRSDWQTHRASRSRLMPLFVCGLTGQKPACCRLRFTMQSLQMFAVSVRGVAMRERFLFVFVYSAHGS